jgi:hypothetical protein
MAIEIINLDTDGFATLYPQQLQLGAAVVSAGQESARPSAGIAGRLWFSTDTGTLSRDNGSTWDDIAFVNHADLTIGADPHTAYVLATGTRALTGHVSLVNSSPTNALHAASKGYVDAAIAAKKDKWHAGIGFKAGAIDGGDVFARVPILSPFNGYTLISVGATARVAGSGTSTIDIQKGTGAGSPSTISTLSLDDVDQWMENSGLSESLATNDYITATVTAANGHEDVGLFFLAEKAL